jgi:hypothetical protein
VTEPEPPPPAKVPLWRNPFVLAFVIGVVLITAMPFLQRRTLRAPPPGPTLGNWQLQRADGGVVGAPELKGKVWLASYAVDPARRAEFGDILRHVEDLGSKIVLVSLVTPGEIGPKGNDQWLVLSGSHQQFESLAMQHFQPAFRQALLTRNAGGFSEAFDAGSTLAEWLQIPAIAVVDQDGALRVFWNDQALGRGNAINAARLLAKEGASP